MFFLAPEQTISTGHKLHVINLYIYSNICHMTVTVWSGERLEGCTFWFLSLLSLFCSAFNGTELEKITFARIQIVGCYRCNHDFLMFISTGLLLRSLCQHFREAMTPLPPNGKEPDKKKRKKKVQLLLGTNATEERIRMIRNGVRIVMNAVLPYLAPIKSPALSTQAGNVLF